MTLEIGLLPTYTSAAQSLQKNLKEWDALAASVGETNGIPGSRFFFKRPGGAEKKRIQLAADATLSKEPPVEAAPKPAEWPAPGGANATEAPLSELEKPGPSVEDEEDETGRAEEAPLSEGEFSLLQLRELNTANATNASSPILPWGSATGLGLRDITVEMLQKPNVSALFRSLH